MPVSFPLTESAPAPPTDDDLRALAAELAARLLARKEMMACAESCTGGLLAARCTDLPGSSRWFERGYVVYSNAAKTDLLGVPEALIAQQGAVSAGVVQALVAGLLARTPAQAGLAISGVAGPDGGTPDKPVGLVHMAWGGRDARTERVDIETQRRVFPGDRDAVRRHAAGAALAGLADWLARH